MESLNLVEGPSPDPIEKIWKTNTNGHLEWPFLSKDCPGLSGSWEEEDFEVEVGEDENENPVFRNLGIVTVTQTEECPEEGCEECGGRKRVPDITDAKLFKVLLKIYSGLLVTDKGLGETTGFGLSTTKDFYDFELVGVKRSLTELLLEALPS